MQPFDSAAPPRPPPERVELVVGGRIWATWALIGVNVLAFLWMLSRGAGAMGPDVDLALELGAAQFHAVRVDGEWWRLVTCTFLHGGVIHLALNMWGLRILGPFVEAYLGAAGFLALYLISGVAASVVSTHWNPEVVGLGASGSIFGILGSMLAFYVRHRREIPPSLRRAQTRSIGMLIVLNVLLGFSIPHVDNAAHIGGLAFGFLGGFLLDRPLLEPPRMTTRRSIGAVVLLGLVFVLAPILRLVSAIVHGWG